jgi:hypothetical protein
MGDFNLIRDPSDQSRLAGDTNNVLLFNIVIQTHDLQDIALKGRSYTWSNTTKNQPELDWIFTSPE